VIQAGSQHDLTEEALRTERQLAMQQFECNRAIVLLVAGEVDRCHATTPELPLNHIAAPKGVSQRRINRGHETAKWEVT
jgi:hypothetical protein